MTENLLAVPVYLDVLRLEKPMRVAGPLLDFTRLPWTNSPAHRDSPFLSETIAAAAFEDQHQLQPGLHFHWSLPLALTKTSSIGIVYRQSFQSVFGKGAQANDGTSGDKLNGDNLWSALVNQGWLQVIDERIGMARATLPNEEKLIAWLEEKAPNDAQAVLKLLRTSVFPPVPNRWLLSRIVDGKSPTIKMIESDYLWPVGQERIGADPMADHFTIYPQITDNPDEQPYRFLGRAYDWGSDAPQDSPEYLDTPLTVAGYGEPAFAAFYPICRSVFGYYDPTPTQEEQEQFELIGLYADPAHDYFRIFVDAFKTNWQADHQTEDATDAQQQRQQVDYLYLDLLDAIHRQLRLDIPIAAPQNDLQNIGPDEGVVASDGAPQNAWEYLQQHRWIDEQGQLLPKAYSTTTVVGGPFQTRASDIRKLLNGAIEAQMPDRLICYARVDCPADESALPAVDSDKIKIAIGNSPTEALSALLASEISADRKSTIEDQLEAIQFASKLQQTSVDTGPVFEAARHEKEFHAVAAGQRWRIKAQREADRKAGQVAEDEQVTLPEALANELNQLNRLEDDKYRNDAAIDSLRRQIYADWCWYLKMESGVKEIDDAPDFGLVPDAPQFGAQVGKAYLPKRRPTPPFGTHVGQPEAENTASAEPTLAAENLYVIANRGLVSDFKAFISDEIDNQLTMLLRQMEQSKQKVAEQLIAVQAALLEHQVASQFLLESDIVDWGGFTAAVSQFGDPTQSLPAPDHRAVYLLAINERLAARAPMGWPQNVAISSEYQSLGQLADALAKSSGEDAPASLLDSLLLRANRLALEAHCPGLIKHRPAVELVARAASRFWRPNDPVVLIGGFDPTPRHQDIRNSLPARLLSLDGEQYSDDLEGFMRFRSFLEQALFQGNVTNGRAPSWHPVFLAWDIAFSQAHLAQEHYGQDYLLSNYALGNTDFEVAQAGIKIQPRQSGQARQATTYDSPIPFYGRSLLTPSARLSLKKTIINRLVPILYRQFVDESGKSGNGQQATLALFGDWLKGIDPQVTNLPVQNPDFSDEQQIRQWLANELELQNDTDAKLVQHLLAYLQPNSPLPILQQFLNETSGADLAGNIDPFLDWTEARSHIKASYAAQRLASLDEPLDSALLDDDQVHGDFVAQLQSYLGESLQRFYTEKNIQADQQADYLDDHYNEVIGWYQPQVREAMHLTVEIRAYQALLGIKGLTQAMSGFGDALIMRHQAFQLPVYNPFPLDSDDAFTAKVREAVQTANKVAPSEYLPFSPWRANKTAMSELELLDNWGRYWPPDLAPDLEDFTVQTTNTLPDVGETPGQEFAMPPRLAQGARLAFRWLAASSEIEEMNDHPASNPICGWVTPNNLDDSLMIYAAEGDALGSIDEGGQWRTFPGNRGPIIPADIANPHLAQLVQWLCAQGQDFLADFLSTLDMAQENMEPESFAQHEALALLMGHPLALVRADVRLQLQESPAINMSERTMQGDVQSYINYKNAGANGPPPPRHTFDFEAVQVPLRLGEFHRLNDGLAGYWLEDGNGRYANDTFYALQTVPTPGLSPQIITRHQANSEDRDESQFLIALSLDENAPLTISMLIDPRAPIHATTGILPVKTLYIPTDQYETAIQRMQVAFLTAPLLAPELGLELSLPTEPGYDWNWVQLKGQHWSTISGQGTIRQHQLADAFGAASGLLWQVLLQQGWLEALNADTARMVAEDQRPNKALPAPFDQAQEAVELLFHRLRIRPFDSKAHFDGTQHIREGWLRLSPTARTRQKA